MYLHHEVEEYIPMLSARVRVLTAQLIRFAACLLLAIAVSAIPLRAGNNQNGNNGNHYGNNNNQNGNGTVPVPEPMSAVLFATGLASLAVLARGKYRQ
jgi:hypothetical protein